MSETPTTPPEGVPGAGQQPAPYGDPTAPSWTEPVSPPPPPAYPYDAQPEAPTPYGAPASAPDYGAGYPPAPQYPSQDQYQQQYQQGQSGYGQAPAGYGYPPPTVSPYGQPQNNTSALVLLIVSLISIVFCGGLLVIPAAIMGGISLSRQSTDPESSRNLSKWGWIAYAIGIVVSIIVAVVFIAFVISSADNGSSFDSGY